MLERPNNRGAMEANGRLQVSQTKSLWLEWLVEAARDILGV